MAKRTVQKNSRSGLAIEPAPFFGYEVSLYKLYKGRAELAGCKLYSSPKELKIKKDTIYIDCKDFLLMKCIDLLYAPEEYIVENNLNVVKEEPNVRKSKSRSKKR